jgi:TolB-like protein/tetratricopeptide (TPR) repeat protein
VRLISELKRRNVFRMAVLYIVTAWLVIQVVSALMDLGALPEWIGPWTLVVLAIGFPIAVAISWFFEVTPEGVALEKDVAEGEPLTRATGRRMDFIVIAILAAGLMLFAYDKWGPEGRIERSIAVLAFDNLGGGPDEEYFSDGIAEEILNRLAQIQPLKVIARQSSFYFKGKDVDIATIAERLTVGWVLAGSVRRHGEQVRISVQLVDARDSTNAWSGTYDRELSAVNLIHVQREVARAVTRELRMTLTETDEQRLVKVPTENTEAYTAYLLGRDRLRGRKVAELRDAVGQFARAIELDPIFAAAYSGFADACYLYHNYSGRHTHEACPNESDASQEELSASLMPLVNKALELDDQLGEAWITRGMMLRAQVVGYPEEMPTLREAHVAFERGLELSPSHSQGYHWYALSLPYVQFYDDPPHGWIKAWEQDTWQSVARRGLEVDPLSVPLHSLLAATGIWSKEVDEAYWHAHRIVEIAPDSPRGYERLADLSQYESGRLDEAIKWLQKAARADERNPNHPFQIGDAYAALGDLEMALAYYRRVRGIIPADATGHRTLMAEALAWLGSRRDDADANARESLALSDVYDAERLEIELSLDSSATRAQELLSRFKDHDPGCFAHDADHDERSICPPVVYFLDGKLGDAETAQRRLEMLYEQQNTISVFDRKAVGPVLLRDLSLLGRHEEALDLLEEMVQSGWRIGVSSMYGSGGLRFDLYRNVLLDAIRDHPRFQAMVAVIESDMGEQLEKVREMERKGELPTLQEMQEGLIVDSD